MTGGAGKRGAHEEQGGSRRGAELSGGRRKRLTLTANTLGFALHQQNGCS